MRRFAGACRFVYNKALALQKERFARGEKKLGYAGLCKLLTEWRNRAETAWLAASPVHPLQQALKDLERAYANFFAKRADFPRFKKKGRSDSFRYPDPKQIKLDQVNSRIFLPKLGWLRYRKSREVPGAVKTSPSASPAASGSFPFRLSRRSRNRFHVAVRSALTWALPGSLCFQTVRFFCPSTASGSTKSVCARRSRRFRAR